MNKQPDFSHFVTQYFTQFLIGQRGVSENTVISYRDTFSLLLAFLAKAKNWSPQNIRLQNITRHTIEEFLLWLTNERGNSVNTCNQRLAAIHSFFLYIQFECPELLMECQRILSIENKVIKKTLIRHLSENEMGAILSQPDITKKTGRRDAAMLSLLYDSGARVSELIDLKVRDMRLQKPYTVKLLGKGQKARIIHLIDVTVNILRNYMEENNLLCPNKFDHPLFFNSWSAKLTRQGVAYIVKKYAASAKPDIGKISPHIFRHTKAMHLLNCGENMYHVRDVLGHSEVSTTENYARYGMSEKKAAFEKANSQLFPNELPSWKKDDNLGSWLKSLCRKD